MVQTALLEAITTRLHTDRLEDTLPILETATSVADELGLFPVADDLQRIRLEVRDVIGQLRLEAQYRVLLDASTPREHTDRLAAILPLLELATRRTSKEWLPPQLPDMTDYVRGEVLRVVVQLRSNS